MQKCFYLKVFLFFLMNTSFSFADDEEVSKLDQIKNEVSVIQKEVDSLKSSIAVIQADLKKLNASIKVILDRENKLKKQLSQIKVDKIAIENYINDLKGRLLEVEVRTLNRLKALYIAYGNKASNINNNFQDSLDFSDLSRAAYYTKYLKNKDKKDIEEIYELRGRQSLESTKLEKLHFQQSSLLAEATLQRNQLESRKKSVDLSMQQLVEQKNQLNEKVVKLRVQELRLESVLRGLTGGASEEKESKRNNSIDLKDEKFIGDGFGKKSLPGMLNSASVSKRFNLKKGVNGNTYRSKDSDQITLIKGKVSYVGVLPGLENVVIIDHGQRDYTLIGQLSEVLVEKGSILEPNQIVGKRIKEPNGSFIVYIETRVSGKPTDPQIIYKTS
jgi:septal ring factor EnvC (AmiA/AmiB activator)